MPLPTTNNESQAERAINRNPEPEAVNRRRPPRGLRVKFYHRGLQIGRLVKINPSKGAVRLIDTQGEFLYGAHTFWRVPYSLLYTMDGRQITKHEIIPIGEEAIIPVRPARRRRPDRWPTYPPARPSMPTNIEPLDQGYSEEPADLPPAPRWVAQHMSQLVELKAAYKTLRSLKACLGRDISEKLINSLIHDSILDRPIFDPSTF